MVLNIVMVGFFAGVTGLLSQQAVEKAVLDSVPKGTEDLNLRALRKGYELREGASREGGTGGDARRCPSSPSELPSETGPSWS